MYKLKLLLFITAFTSFLTIYIRSMNSMNTEKKDSVHTKFK